MVLVNIIDTESCRYQVRIGTPVRVTRLEQELVYEFSHTQLVGYHRCSFNKYGIAKQAFYVFKGEGQVQVPGVTPRVNLLLCSPNSYYTKKLISFLEYDCAHLELETLSEHFWIKQSARMQARLGFVAREG